MDAPRDLDADHKLDPRSVVAGRLTGAVALAALLGPALLAVVGSILVTPWPAPRKVGALAAAVGVTGLLVTWTLVWPAWRYRFTRYHLDDWGLTIRRGVWWRAVTSVPTSRVQHTDVVQGPIQRQFELATLVVHTAGTQDAAVSLSGLAHHDALSLRDALVSIRDDDPGHDPRP